MRSLGFALGVLALFALAPPLRGEDEEEAPAFEVVVLGTHHAPTMFGGDSYTPAHIRATLENAKPDVVAVESHPKWFAVGRYHVVTYEAEGVAVPWARSKGLPVYGVDEKDVEDWDRRAEQKSVQEVEGLRTTLGSGAPLPPSLFALASASDPGVTWEHMNSEEFGRRRYRGKSPDDADFAAPRDRGIARNVVRVMQDHPGKRIAVVIGAHHKPYLEILLRKEGNVRVLELGDDVPFPTEEGVASSWTTPDLLATLGHGLETDGPVDLPRMKRLLAMLEDGPGAAEAASYFRARVSVREGRTEEAEALLSKLLDSEAELYPFPMRHWRMRYALGEAAKVEQARLLVARDAKEEAKLLLDAVAESLLARLSALEERHEPVRRSVLALKDPGFEAGGRAGDIFAGWDTYGPSGHGRLAFQGDPEQKLEGERSLRVEVAEANPMGYGFFVRQAAQVSPLLWKGGELSFGVQLRGAGVDTATVEVTQPWYGEPHTYASKTVDLSSGEWTRAELSCPLPPQGGFYVRVHFDGAAGAKLWLDDGTPIRLEYETVPEEWPHLARAAHYPRFLLSAPAEPTGTPQGSSALASSPMEGWYCWGAGRGFVQVAREGERISLEVLETLDVGRNALTRSFPVPADTPMEFSVTLGIESEDVVTLVAYEYPTPSRAVQLATVDVRRQPDAGSRHVLRFRTSSGQARASIHVYLPARKGSKVWVEDAKLEPAE